MNKILVGIKQEDIGTERSS